MTATKRPAPPQDRPSHNSTDTPDSTTDLDFDRHIVDRVDESIWRAVYNGEFRLAVRCDVCGRWLTDGRSKRAHRGPRCAEKAGNRG